MSHHYEDNFETCPHCDVRICIESRVTPGFRDVEHFDCPKCGKRAGEVMCTHIYRVYTYKPMARSKRRMRG
jgi:hypothetical protein